jgi:hypothetical protein
MNASRASMALQGLLPPGEGSAEDLDRRLLDGRYCELSMLFYLGKDLLRWMDQCVEQVESADGLHGNGIQPQSFATLLIEDTPPEVADKLRAWGVVEYKNIFSRALGLHAVFEELPDRSCLGDDFTRYYHRYADQLHACRQQLFHFRRISPGEFTFQLYASGEYSRMLEQEWERPGDD